MTSLDAIEKENIAQLLRQTATIISTFSELGRPGYSHRIGGIMRAAFGYKGRVLEHRPTPLPVPTAD